MLTATWVVTMAVLGAALVRDDALLTVAGALIGLVAVSLALRGRTLATAAAKRADPADV
ncbi:MAG TPA: hypothetical protein VN238_15700 [Solirubrobacteraceae bacterium]|nr:hypothetical protein [Solirubrobacteraceae bacterium]